MTDRPICWPVRRIINGIGYVLGGLVLAWIIVQGSGWDPDSATRTVTLVKYGGFLLLVGIGIWLGRVRAPSKKDKPWKPWDPKATKTQEDEWAPPPGWKDHPFEEADRVSRE